MLRNNSNKYYHLCDIRANSSITNKIYLPDIIVSGYTGHVPTMQEKFGKNLKDLFLEAVVDFEASQTHERYRKFDFELQKLLEEGSITKEDLPSDSKLHYLREQMPLKAIAKQAEPFQCDEKDWNTSVYKMCNNNCDKRFISGYQGHCPRLLHRFGETYDVSSHNSLNDFTDVYRQKTMNKRFSLVHS